MNPFSDPSDKEEVLSSPEEYIYASPELRKDLDVITAALTSSHKLYAALHDESKAIPALKLLAASNGDQPPNDGFLAQIVEDLAGSWSQRLEVDVLRSLVEGLIEGLMCGSGRDESFGDAGRIAYINKLAKGGDPIARDCALLYSVLDEISNCEELIPGESMMDYMRGLIDDCYPDLNLDGGRWPYNHVTLDWDAALIEFKCDYTAVDIFGNSYYAR